MSRETRIGIAVVTALGLLVFGLLTLGSLGGLNPELEVQQVDEVLNGANPATRFGTEEIRVVGWYAELAADCVGSSDPAGAAAWLERDCPLRVLMPSQPSVEVDQGTLETGLRLAAPDGRPFPSRAEPGGPNLRLQQLVFVGHFDDPAAASCPADLRDRCRRTFVVRDYDGYVR